MGPAARRHPLAAASGTAAGTFPSRLILIRHTGYAPGRLILIRYTSQSECTVLVRTGLRLLGSV